MPDIGETRVIPLPSRGQVWMLAVPAFAPPAAVEALVWSVKYFNEVSATPTGREDLSPEQRAELRAVVARMSRYAPRGFNNRLFLAAAHELNIPYLPLPGGVFQYGCGARGRWLESSFTETTSNISSKLARNKIVTSALLRQAGVPAPEQRLVSSVGDALEAARALGFPVVVKPVSEDGGLGVSAGLASEPEVRAAFERARKHVKEILVEKHIDGRDYRVYVFRGRAIWAIERVPAGVTGDGVLTVKSLVARANLDPRRGDEAWAPLALLELGEEALELLALAELTPDSILESGRFARLRRAANINVGGTPVPVFDRMHPDNARLCERAAQILRLDLAGVDLLIPDIRRSWKESGAGICEINAQPQISGVAALEVFSGLLSEIVPMRGRIPTALVLTAESDAAIVQETADLLAQRNVCAGTSSAAGLRIGAQCIRPDRGSAFKDTRALLIDPSVEAIVIATDGKEFLANGLPLDRFDVLVVAGWNTIVKGDTRVAAARLRSMLTLLQPHCAGPVLVPRDHRAAAVVAGVFGMRRMLMTESVDDLSARLAHELLAR